MKAVRIHEYGGPEVLLYEDVPQPVPAEGEILIQIKATGVNPADATLRAGFFRGMFDVPLPHILGFDLAGIVTEIGAGVTEFAPGDEVYAMAGWRNGAHAEYIALSATDAALKPTSLNFIEAASLPVASLTSYQAIFDVAGLSAGQTLLVHAASGGVGSIAVQLAKARGCRVIGTASGRNEEFVRSLGVDEFVDYTATRFEEVVSGVDVVFDTIGGDTHERSYKVLKPNGFLVAATQPPNPEALAAHGVRGGMVGVVPSGSQLREVAGLVDAGQVKAHVELVLPLSKVQEAHQKVETHHTRGKIVLQVGE